MKCYECGIDSPDHELECSMGPPTMPENKAPDVVWRVELPEVNFVPNTLNENVKSQPEYNTTQYIRTTASDSALKAVGLCRIKNKCSFCGGDGLCSSGVGFCLHCEGSGHQKP